MLFLLKVFAQSKTISGTVTEKCIGPTLLGVFIERTSVGGVNDFVGIYSFEIYNFTGKILVFSFVILKQLKKLLQLQ